MSDQRGIGDKPVSVAQIAADDRLLDALGRGEPLDGDAATDPAATMLAAWRADLDGDADGLLDDPLDDADWALIEADPALDGASWAPDGADGTLDGADWDPVDKEPAPLPTGDPQRKRRLVQAILGAAAAAVVTVGLGVSAHQAQPGSILWPVSKVVYPQRAEVKAAEKALADAKVAFAEGRLPDARALLATAAAHIEQIDDGATATRLRAEVDALLRTLNAAVAPPPAPTRTPAAPPATTPSPGATRPAPGGSSGTNPSPGGDEPAPQPSESSGGGLLPPLPLPTPLLPLPLPTLPPILGG